MQEMGGALHLLCGTLTVRARWLGVQPQRIACSAHSQPKKKKKKKRRRQRPLAGGFGL